MSKFDMLRLVKSGPYHLALENRGNEFYTASKTNTVTLDTEWLCPPLSSYETARAAFNLALRRIRRTRQ